MTKVYGKLAPTEEQCERFFAKLNSIEQGEDSKNRFTSTFDIG
jgi:hypothetical protein